MKANIDYGYLNGQMPIIKYKIRAVRLLPDRQDIKQSMLNFGPLLILGIKTNNMNLQQILSSTEGDPLLRQHKHPLTSLTHSPLLIDIYHHQPQTDPPHTLLPLKTTFTLLIPHSDPTAQSSNDEMVYARRGSPILEDFDIGAFHKKSKEKPPNPIQQCGQNILTIMATIRKGRSIEIIKTEWPHGKELQVSYLTNHHRWIVSDGYVSLSADQQQNKESLPQKQNTPLTDLTKVWFRLLSTIKNMESLKTALSLYTLCGKVNESFHEVTWYALVKTNPNKRTENICEDPFDAQERIQKFGLRFIKIKSLGIFKQEQKIIHNIEKTYQTVIASFCQSKNNVFGRSRIYFVANGSSEVIGGYNLNTLEDLIFHDMSQLIIGSRQTSCHQFQEKLRGRISQSQSYPPYPDVFYINTFDHIRKMIKQIDASQERIKDKWLELIKISLFLKAKRLPISPYASIVIQKQALNNRISSLPLKSYGPLQCKMTVVYFFAGLEGACSTQLAQALAKQFISLDLHFQIIKKDFKPNDLLHQLTAQSYHPLKHYFIQCCPRISQIHLLEKELHNHSGNNVHYKIILVTEQLPRQTIIAENIYPQSYHSIINYYHQAFEQIRHARRIEQKIIHLRKVTESLLQFKNYDLISCKHTINIKIDNQSQSFQAKNLLEHIFEFPKDDQKCYQRLLVHIEKYHQLQVTWDLQGQAAKIISNSYYSLPNIDLDQ